MKFGEQRALLERQFGIVFPKGMAMDYYPEGVGENFDLAMDAQAQLVTTSNAGIPAYLANYLDPDFIRVLTTPNKAAQIIGEQKKGDWTTQTAQFPIVESTGETSSYGDFNNNGSIGSNVNWVPRQSYLFQTITQWGELELDRAGLAKINYAANLNIASALVMDKFMNKSYFFGISGLINYGLLNDPSLSTPITGTAWSALDGAGVYSQILLIYSQLISQTAGILDQNTPMTLAMSPTIAVNLTKTNQYNVNVTDQLKKNFPNLKIETAVEYNTTNGQLIQLIVDSIDGQDTGYAAFTEKMHAHPIKTELSSWAQKKSGGTWGTVIRMPICIAQYLGA